MIQALHVAPDFLDRTVAALVEKFKPECIYLFGSRARGDHRPDSDYDLYMEVSSENWPDDERHTEDGFLTGRYPAEIHVRVPGWLALNESDPGRVMYDVAREGILLYGTPGHQRVIPSAPKRFVREKPPERSAAQSAWFELAREDLDLTDHLSSDIDKWKRPICFHAHQAAEKFLKGLIAAHQKPPRTHDLIALLDIARNVGCYLGGMDRRCRRLNPLATRGRYTLDRGPAFPRTRSVSLDEARQGIADARAMAEAVEREIV